MSAQPPPISPNPQPPAGPYADSLAPQPPPQNLNSDITDELTDHLSLSARDLQLAGHTPDEAQELAHQKFGNLAAIRRRLWWIQKGDEIMLRTALAVVMVVLVLAVAALGIGGWQISHTMNELGDTLATMNETQRALLASREKEDRPLAIRGRLYLGDKSKPASYASVNIYSLPDGKKVDTLIADQGGRFGTSSLKNGNYTLLAKLVPSEDDRSTPNYAAPDFYATQSRPISVYPWSKDTTVELDVAMIKYGRVTFELAKPFPLAIEIGLSDGDMKRKVTAYPALALAIPKDEFAEALPIERLSRSQDVDWPVIGFVGQRLNDHAMFDAPFFNANAYRDKQPLPVGSPIAFPRGTRRNEFQARGYQVGAYLTFSYSMEGATDGIIPAWQIIGESNLTTLPERSRASFEVADHRRTHLRITPPEDFEQTLRKAILQTDGDNKELRELQQKPFAVNVEVVGQMDLFDPQEWSPSSTGHFDVPSGGFGDAR